MPWFVPNMVSTGGKLARENHAKHTISLCFLTSFSQTASCLGATVSTSNALLASVLLLSTPLKNHWLAHISVFCAECWCLRFVVCTYTDAHDAAYIVVLAGAQQSILQVIHTQQLCYAAPPSSTMRARAAARSCCSPASTLFIASSLLHRSCVAVCVTLVSSSVNFEVSYAHAHSM